MKQQPKILEDEAIYIIELPSCKDEEEKDEPHLHPTIKYTENSIEAISGNANV